MHNEGKCQKELRHDTLLSQHVASAQEQQGQVLSFGEKKTSPVELKHILRSHMSSHMCLCFLCVQVFHLEKSHRLIQPTFWLRCLDDTTEF